MARFAVRDGAPPSTRLHGLSRAGSCLLLGLASCFAPARSLESSWPAPRAGAVVSEHPLATQVGLSVLERGGNAADAAVATALALAVVLPRAGNLGGGGFALHADHGGEALFLDFRETAPMA
ncbi:MAG: gamma-glutamyltransferase, partial [Planctomycetia bacterium]